MRWYINNPFSNTIYCHCCSHVSAKFSFPYANENFLSVPSKFHASGYICLFVCLSQNCTYRAFKYSQKLILQILPLLALRSNVLAASHWLFHPLGFQSIAYGTKPAFYHFRISHLPHRSRREENLFNCASQKQWSVLSPATSLMHFYFLYYKCSKVHCTFSVGYR